MTEKLLDFKYDGYCFKNSKLSDFKYLSGVLELTSIMVNGDQAR